MPRLHAHGLRLHRRFVVFAVALSVTGALLCSRDFAPAQAAPSGSVPKASDLAALGKKIFFDTSLSASGRVACATCHSPNHAYGPSSGLAVQLGGADVDRQGIRAVPSLRYVLNRTPAYGQNFVENPLERLIEGSDPPKGGLGWDGRFNTLREQAAFPLLAANEMANASAADVAARLQHAAYADDFREVFGARIFGDPVEVYADALLALERFELEDASFHPYSSKYDDYLDGKVQLSEQERRGLALFDDPKRGNCASCHVDRKGVDGSHPLFTDYEFEALGVPRNPEIQANAAPDYYDMGLCGPLRADQAGRLKNCGLFKTPTLRNVATRAAFFHNGRFHTLREALRFYVRRDTDPRLWYPVSGAGEVMKFDDLPAALRGNIDIVDEPLTRKEGEAPAWSDAEIDDVIAFLQTLTDRDTLPAEGAARGPVTHATARGRP